MKPRISLSDPPEGHRPSLVLKQSELRGSKISRSLTRTPISELKNRRRLTSIEQWSPLHAAFGVPASPSVDKDVPWSASTFALPLDRSKRQSRVFEVSGDSGLVYEMADTSRSGREDEGKLSESCAKTESVAKDLPGWPLVS